METSGDSSEHSQQTEELWCFQGGLELQTGDPSAGRRDRGWDSREQQKLGRMGMIVVCIHSRLQLQIICRGDQSDSSLGPVDRVCPGPSLDGWKFCFFYFRSQVCFLQVDWTLLC